MNSFIGLGISSFFAEQLGKRGIQHPTEIQKLVIPRILGGEQVIFRSATGTGKTFAYLLPLFERLVSSFHTSPNPSGVRILIIAPTLELCSQIKQEADFLLQAVPVLSKQLKTSLIIGSANINRQIEGLKKERPAIIIGNPARLLHLQKMGKLKLGQITAVVLDEGDRLISDELLPDTQELVCRINPNRQTAACSATVSKQSRERLLPLMGEPVITVETEAQDILRNYISHWALFSESRRKIRTLCSFLNAGQVKKGLVFTNRGSQVGNIVSQLQYHKISATGLYSDMDKKLRKQALDDFRAERAKVLVSSDLSARGLDIPDISHIIALDVPSDGEAYIHRVGRTGRAGKHGIAVTIGDEEELRRFAGLEKKLGIIVYPKILYQGKILDPVQEED